MKGFLNYIKKKKASEYEQVKEKIEKNINKYGEMYGKYMIRRSQFIFSVT